MKSVAACGTVAVMATPRSRHAARLRARRRRAQQRARVLVLLVVVGVLGLVTAAVTAFGAGGSATAVRPLDTAAVTSVGSVQPSLSPVARIGNLQVQLAVPASEVTAIGFHGARDGALSLKPVGRQVNEGLLARLWRSIAGARRDGPRWYQLEGAPGTEVLDIGAAPGTDVYSPADGTIVAINPVVLDGRTVGARIDIRPTDSPSVIVSLTHVRPDPVLAVGMPVLARTSKLGTCVDIATFERQALAQHARERGNNVAISVYPSPGSLP
jgi:hypothetical protein